MQQGRFVGLALSVWLVACGSEPKPGASGGGAAGAATAGGTSAGAGGTAQPAAGGGESGGAEAAGSGNPALPTHSIAATDVGTCAIDLAGQVRCWGHYPDSSVMFEPPSGSFEHVVAGSFMCAQRSTGELSCFQVPESSEPVEIAPTGPVKDFDIGVSAMCSLDDAGKITCPRLDVPASADREFTRIAVGRDYVCGIRVSDSGIECWGYAGSTDDCGTSPQSGQLDAPTGEFVAIDAEYWTACGIRKDGTLACWGVGDSTDDPNQTFCDDKLNWGQAIPPQGTFTQVSVGTSHACAVRTDGSVACWGAGTVKGECPGNLDMCGQAAPPAGKFAQVSAGFTHSCGMHADRSVECWGSNTGDRGTPPADFP